MCNAYWASESGAVLQVGMPLRLGVHTCCVIDTNRSALDCFPFSCVWLQGKWEYGCLDVRVG